MPVFKNEDNGTWYVMARYVNWKGERKQKCKRGFATKKEAQEWERMFQLQNSSDLDMSFEAFTELYIRDVKNRLKENTWLTTAHRIGALGIREIKKKPYAALSTGQKRRLHLAPALTGNPNILFLDEPTAGLDVESKLSLHDQIRRWKSEEITVVLASHDMTEVESLCNRMAVLKDGNIVFCGTASSLTDQMGGAIHCPLRTIKVAKGWEPKISMTLCPLCWGNTNKGA